MIVQTREDFENARTVLLDADVIAIDTETTKTPCWTNRELIGLGCYCGIQGRENYFLGVYLPFRHNHDSNLFGQYSNVPLDWLSDLIPALERDDVTWVLHNAPFDLAILRKEGVNLRGTVDDTICMSHLVDENLYSFDLDNVAKHYVPGTEGKLGSKELKVIEKSLGGWDKIPPDVMGNYCIQDCKATYEVREVLLPLLEKEELTQLWETEDRKYLRILSQVTENGILFDREQSQELASQAQRRMQEIRLNLGFDVAKKAEVARILFGPPTVGGLECQPLVLSKQRNSLFPQGIPSTKEEDLQRISLAYPLSRPIIEQVLEFRRWQLSNSFWYSKFLELAGEDDLLHPGFKQHGTKTGRLSSSEPNLQQIPRDLNKSPVKRLFISPPGFELWEFDYSQLELRLAACYAGQENMKDAYLSGADNHHITAEFVGALDNPELSYDQARYVGKTCNFLLIYLGGADTLQSTLWREGRLDVPLGECEDWHSQWHALYPNFRTTAMQAMGAAAARGFIKYWNGRKRHLPWRDEQSKAFNSLIQGGCGQIVKTTMIMLDEDPRFTSKMVNQVHDSLWIYIRKDEVESQKKLIIDTMEWPSHESDFGIPFPVEGKLLADGGEDA